MYNNMVSISCVFVCLILCPTLVFGTVKELKEFSCGFETDFCGWHKPDWSSYTWSRTKYKSLFSSSGSGPSAAYEKDYYIYFNNTFLSPNSEAYLESVPIAENINRPCLRFYYHMYGSTMGSLEIGLLQDDIKKQLWQRSGDQMNKWHCGKVDLSSAFPGNTIYLKAVRGQDLYTVMAIDNVQLFINVKSCEADCDMLEDSPSVTKSIQIQSTTIVTSPTPKNTTTFEDAFPAFMYSLQWTVGIPSGVIVFSIVLFVVVKVINRRERKEKIERESLPLQLLFEHNQSTKKQKAPPADDNFFAITAPAPIYSEIGEREEHIYAETVVRNSSSVSKKNGGKSSSVSKTINGGGLVAESKTSKVTNGQIVKCEINHHNCPSSSKTDYENCPSIQTEESDYVTLKQ